MKKFVSKILNSPFYSAAFRPMFFLSALGGFLLPKFWLSYYLNNLDYNGRMLNFFNWHTHEMIYGFAMALISGFLLTASANWSGNKPLVGSWLFFLSLFWILERFSLALPLTLTTFTILNLPFFLLFFYMAFKQLKGNFNLKIMLPLILLFIVGKFCILFGDQSEIENLVGFGRDLSLGGIRFLICLMALRLIPFFSSKYSVNLQIQKISKNMQFYFLTIMLCADLTKASSNLINLPYLLPCSLYVISFCISLFIIREFKPLKTKKEPMLLILNIGFCWLQLSLLAEASIHYFELLKNANIHIHLLTAGALGTFAIGMMTRVSLGHTGRPIHASKWVQCMFAFVTIGAATRVITPLINHSIYISLLHTIAGFWVSSFFLYLIVFSKYLFSPRPDGKIF